MVARPALRELAERVGVLSSYQELGTRARRQTNDDARVSILTAMGLPAGDEAAAARTLDALREEESAQPLEPLRVVAAERAAPLRLRAAAGPVSFEAALELEDGGVLATSGRGRLTPAGLVSGVRLPPPPPGRHRLRLVCELAGGRFEGEQVWIAAPARAVGVNERLGGSRVFGLWANLWSVRREGGGGAGDATALAGLARFAGERGATFLGVNPLHALRNRGEEVSPYAPVSRLFRNPLYLDVEAVPELDDCDEAKQLLASDSRRRTLAALRRADRIDYDAVADAQRPVLDALHRHFARQQRGGGHARGRAYEAFLSREGPLLRDFGVFCALEEARSQAGDPRDWRRWPASLRSPHAPAVQDFAHAHDEAVDRHMWLQFELDRQLGEAAAAGRDAGLTLGLYQDLAVGSAISGFDPWAFPGLFLEGVRLGAPPDDYSATGQDWGLPPMDPRRLAARDHGYWVRVLRSAFRHTGMLRIDHVMGLYRQFWVCGDGGPGLGAYVRFPHEVLMGILALESRRHHALVVGEDLGTVPQGFAARLARRGILSSRVLLFERDRRGSYRPPGRYSPRALVTATTHDLPPLAGFLAGRDLELRAEIGALPEAASLAALLQERAGQVRALLRRLRGEGLLAPDETSPEAVCAAVSAFLLRTPCPLAGLSLDDLAGETVPVNLPGVPPDRYPSWTRPLSRSLESLLADPAVALILEDAQRRADLLRDGDRRRRSTSTRATRTMGRAGS